ncbi:MAG: hypothetical protein ACT4QA_04685 [Panacagrimonas sp.]
MCEFEQRQEQSMNARSTPLFVAITLGAMLSASVQAGDDGTRLTADALARCANQVKTLREESARLMQLNARHDQTRAMINHRSAALQAERDAMSPDDLAKGLDFNQRMIRHTFETATFNQTIAEFKREIIAIDALKTDYDRHCAQRPYRRADLDALPDAAAREAMRAGLSGVQVPYLDPAALVTPPEQQPSP